jgi:hypothetical protein
MGEEQKRKKEGRVQGPARRCTQQDAAPCAALAGMGGMRREGGGAFLHVSMLKGPPSNGQAACWRAGYVHKTFSRQRKRGKCVGETKGGAAQ